MRRSLVAAAAALMLLGACSGDDDTAATTPPTSEAAPPTTAAATTSTTSTPATVAATEPARTSSVTSAPAPTTLAAADPEWCLRAAELNQLTADFRELDAGDSAGIEAALATILDRVALIEPVAPSSLALDLAVSNEAFRLLDAALQQSGYDLTEADLSELDERADEIAEANARIREYNHTMCGFDAPQEPTEEAP
jgi:hypothetical protein